MTDGFSRFQTGLSDPITDGAAVSPDNSTDLATFSRALWVGTGGDVKVDTTGGSTITFTNVADGTLLPVRARRVYATGTDATNIVAVW